MMALGAPCDVEAGECLVRQGTQHRAAAVDVRHDQPRTRVAASGREHSAAVAAVDGALAAGCHDFLDAHQLGCQAHLGERCVGE